MTDAESIIIDHNDHMRNDVATLHATSIDQDREREETRYTFDDGSVLIQSAEGNERWRVES